MGYETSFNLRLIDTVNKNRKFTAEWLKEAKIAWRYDSTWSPNGDGFIFNWGEGVKWYDHNMDMIEVSRQHPAIVFILDGEGEAPNDIWRKFYLAGARYEWKRPIVEPPEWDEEIHQKLVVKSVMED